MYFVEALESAESVGQIADSLTTDSAKWKWNARYAKTKHRAAPWDGHSHFWVAPKEANATNVLHVAWEP